VLPAALQWLSNWKHRHISGLMGMAEGHRSSLRSSRLVYLDVARAIAVLLVLGAHLPVETQYFFWGHDFILVWMRMGWVGVDLFFCLSGFLIGGLLFMEYLQRGTIDLKRFYIRRAFKIWPSYLLFVGVATAAVLLSHRSLNLIWPNILHVQSYFPSAYGHTWSLAVEEHFYVILPLLLALLLWLNRGSTRPAFLRLPWIFLIVAAGCLLARFQAASGTAEFDFFRNQAQTHIRFDSLFSGVMLAYAVHMAPHLVERLYPWRRLLLGAGVLCFVPAGIYELNFTPFLYTAGYSLLWLGSMAITLWCWFASTGDPRRSRLVETHPRPPHWASLLAMIGAFSYSIYLWHMPLATASAKFLWNRYLDPDNPASLILLSTVYVMLAVAIGMLLYLIVERPAMAVRDRMYPGMVGVIADKSSRRRMNLGSLPVQP